MEQDNRNSTQDGHADASDKQRTESGKGGGGKGRGFAGMDPKKQRAIASEGGKAAHASGNAHEFSSEEARRAGALSHGGRGRNAGPAGSSSRGGEGGGAR